jgi:uncharacterized delta-60 repeat protein
MVELFQQARSHSIIRSVSRDPEEDLMSGGVRDAAIWRLLVAAITALLLSLAAGSAASQAAMPDPSFGENGFSFVAPGVLKSAAYGMTIDRSGRVILTGRGGPRGDQFYAARISRDGSPDASFGDAGISVTAFSSGSRSVAIANAATVQRSGKIVATGLFNAAGRVYRFSMVVNARFNFDGSVDYPFSGEGRDWTGNYRAYTGNAITQDRRGRFLTAATGSGNKIGWADYGLLNRYYANGEPDPTLNGGLRRRRSGQIKIAAGVKRQITLQDVIAMRDGRILVSGNYGASFMVSRLRPNGSYDVTFGRGGRAAVDVNGRGPCGCRTLALGMARTKRGKIVVAGESQRPGFEDTFPRTPYLVIAQFNANGTRDRSFGRNGIVRFGLKKGITANDVAVQRNGRIVVVGESDFYMTAMRFMPNGRIDRSFFRNGLYRKAVFGQDTLARKVMIDRAGRIVVAGGTDQAGTAFALRILPNAKP